MPYNDMADKCEVLLMEKQKMSRLMSAQQKQDNLVDSLLLNQDNEMKNMDVSNQVDFQKVIPPCKSSYLHYLFNKYKFTFCMDVHKNV